MDYSLKKMFDVGAKFTTTELSDGEKTQTDHCAYPLPVQCLREWLGVT